MVNVTRSILIVTAAVVLAAIPAVAADGRTQEAAARGVLQRLLPDHADRFVMKTIAPADGGDVFEIESRDGRIELRGSSGIALCSALNWYLKYHCFCHTSWSGSQLKLPEPLPAVPGVIRQVAPHRYRYWFNYCAFSYSLAFWDWAQWERHIDWMALHGINMPLAVTGQEATWQAVGHRFGLTDDELRAFLPGPAFLPFGWMGCLDGWGGPLPQSWIDSHRALQQKILARQRELGMTPVLQGFTGHVPPALQAKFPQSKFKQLPKWAKFPSTTFIDPEDPLFIEVGKAFVEEQTRLFGTDHLYASDTFIEMSPPSNDPAFLAGMGRAVYGAMAAADPQATWVMQGWIFFNNPQFWQPPQAKALFNAVPDERLILIEMGWDKFLVTEAYYGKPWMWTVIQNFGNTVGLHGRLARILDKVATARGPGGGKLCGLGMIMEGLDYNPVVFDLVTDLAWRPEMPELKPWVADYVHRRYGRPSPPMTEAWNILLETAYGDNPGADHTLVRRPGMTNKIRKSMDRDPYDRQRLIEAGRAFLECADDYGKLDTYQFDLVHLVRQILADKAQGRIETIYEAYEAKDRQRLTEAGSNLLEVIRDMDTLLAARREFLLGRWLEDAKRWASSDDERRHYEWNARTQITLWGPPDGVLHDYARKQWSGLLTAFHLPRWERFVQQLDAALAADQPFDRNAFAEEMQQWEDRWTHATETYPTEPTGDPVTVARRIWRKQGL